MSDDPVHPVAGGSAGGRVGRASRKLLLWNALVLALAAASAWLIAPYLACFFRGPRPADDAFILAAAGDTSRWLIDYIELRDRRLEPTGYVEESTQDGHAYSVMGYFFLDVGGRDLLVKAPPGETGTRLVGPLGPVAGTADREVQAILARNPARRGRLLPVMLNAAAAFDVFGYVYLSFVTPVVVLCGTNIARALARSYSARA